MNDTDPQDDTSPTSLSVVDSGWYESDELIEKLGTSRRTFFRMINRGEVEKRETPSGMRYRPTDPSMLEASSSPDSDMSANGTPSSGSAKCRHCQVSKGGTPDLIAVSLDDWSELQRKAGRLEVVEAEYAELKSARARLHVAEGRRDLAEERLHQKNQELEQAHDEIKRLRRQLEQAERISRSTWSIFS